MKVKSWPKVSKGAAHGLLTPFDGNGMNRVCSMITSQKRSHHQKLHIPHCWHSSDVAKFSHCCVKLHTIFILSFILFVLMYCLYFLCVCVLVWLWGAFNNVCLFWCRSDCSVDLQPWVYLGHSVEVWLSVWPQRVDGCSLQAECYSEREWLQLYAIM